MKQLYILLLALFFGLSACQTKIEHAKSISVHIKGNCNMCKETIESAGSKSGISKVEWDKKSKMALITFDEKQSNPRKILRSIADAGYENAYFKAKASAYRKLPKCCHYKSSK